MHQRMRPASSHASDSLGRAVARARSGSGSEAPVRGAVLTSALIETIDRLVEIGHYEVQITPDNCSTSLISVDQIVADGHTVTFSTTETIITDDNDRYRLTYPRVPNSREWTVPMKAMEDLSRLRQDHPLRRN